MRRILKTIGLAAMWSALFYSCSADWHIQRAGKIDPSSVVGRIDTVAIPEVRIDTFVTIDKDTAGLSSFIDSVLAAEIIPDTCVPFIKVIKEPIIEYVNAMPVLLDTARYETTFEADGVLVHLELIAFQEGDKIVLSTALIDSKILNETTVITKEPSKKERRIRDAIVFVAGMAAFGIFIIILKLK